VRPACVLLLRAAGARLGRVGGRGVAVRRYDDLKAELVTATGDLVIPGPGSPSRFLCAGFSYDNELTHPLLSLLPPVLHVSPADEGPETPLQSTLRLLMGELSRHHIGSEAATERLIEVLFVHVLRSWLDMSADSTPPSWLTGLRDAVVARALGLLHSQPERAWTVDELAAAVHVSRSTLVRRFNHLVGEPPAAYLTRWRMELAARLLRESEQPLGRLSPRRLHRRVRLLTRLHEAPRRATRPLPKADQKLSRRLTPADSGREAARSAHTGRDDGRRRASSSFSCVRRRPQTGGCKEGVD